LAAAPPQTLMGKLKVPPRPGGGLLLRGVWGEGRKGRGGTGKGREGMVEEQKR